MFSPERESEPGEQRGNRVPVPLHSCRDDGEWGRGVRCCEG